MKVKNVGELEGNSPKF